MDTLTSSPDTAHTVLLVTHGGVVRVIGRYLSALSPTPCDVDKLHVANNCISEYIVHVGEGGVVTGCEVVRIFDDEHLNRPFKE